jgi:hypothetical protein
MRRYAKLSAAPAKIEAAIKPTIEDRFYVTARFQVNTP